MNQYLFIESRDPFESRDTRFVEETSAALKRLGHDVTIFMVQNGVLAARPNQRTGYLNRLNGAGVTLMADDFSLRERGILPAELSAGIQPASIETLVDLLIDPNTKAIWH
jgi:predicted peroxiredoxin